MSGALFKGYAKHLSRPGRGGIGRAWAALILGLSLFAAGPAAAATPFEILPPAEKADGRDRFALVIGNAAYRNVPTLRNPINDANAVGQRLNRLGFDVMLARDLDRRAMNETVDSFLARLTPGADVVVYFAGHGVEVQGANQLLPVDVPKIQYGQDRVLRSETTNLTDLISDLRDKAPRALVIILDACRDNPFAGEGTRSIGGSRGLARVEPPKGSLVIYSAGVGERALDNLGEDDPSPNGLFTRTLLRQMDEEGLEVRDLVRRMRNEVREAALRAGSHSQTPGYYDELLDTFYFRPKPVGDSNVAFCERNAEPEADPVSLIRRNLEPTFQACLRATRAKPGDERLRIAFLAVAEQRAFQSALAAETPDPGSNYLAHYPTGRYAAEVLRHLDRLERGRSGDVAERAEPAPPAAERRIETVAQPAAAPAAPGPIVTKVPPMAPSVPVAALATRPEVGQAVIPGAPPSGTPPPSPAPAEEGRETLARELQDELKRVGCYSGPVDGTWGARARQALVSFNRAAGAGLPSDDPRRASIEAVRLHETPVCQAECGAGRKLGEDGICAAPASPRRANLPAPRPVRAEPKPEPRPEPARAARPEPRPEPARVVRPEPVREKAREVAAPRSVVTPREEPRRVEPPVRRVEAPAPRRSAPPRAVAEPPPAPRLARQAPPPRRAAEPPPVIVQQAPPPAPAPRIGIGIGLGGGRLGIGGIGIGF